MVPPNDGSTNTCFDKPSHSPFRYEPSVPGRSAQQGGGNGSFQNRLASHRAYQYADDPVGATGMMVKDYRGKNGERAIWKF
jgi:hypothetical protein